MLYNEIMAITPQTDIYLLKCPIEADNRNQINFANATNQYNYFSSLPKLAIDNCTYQRHDDVMRLPYHIDDIIQYNYVMYRNEAYGNKWFYAFITNMEYSSDHMTFVYIKTDVFQTWQFDLTYMKSFVEREHVNDDTFGLHTVPEGLEYGDYIVNSYASSNYAINLANCYLIAQVSELCEAMYSVYGDGNRIYNGVPQGCWLIGFSLSDATAYQNFNNFVRSYDAENLSEAIVSVGIVPKAMIPGEPVILSFDTDYGFDAFRVPSSTTATTLATQSFARQTTLNGYTPKNNKMLCSPYNYLLVTNNGGSDVAYAWEEFSGSNANFNIIGALTQGCDIKMIPTNYKSTDGNGGWEWAITSQKFPMVSWNSNFYLNWVAVNGKYQEVQAGLTGLSFATNLIGGMASGNVGQMVGSLGGLAQSVANQAQQIREAKMTPDSAKGNTNTGDLNFTHEKSKFTGYKMSIKAEYARILDDYFTAYGYKVNSFKVPNITGRRYWNYVHTVGANIEGNVPQADMDEIKGLFDRGITIWHDPSHYLDYTQNNTIV